MRAHLARDLASSAGLSHDRGRIALGSPASRPHTSCRRRSDRARPSRFAKSRDRATELAAGMRRVAGGTTIYRARTRRAAGTGATSVREHINAVQAVSETWSPERLLRWAFDTYQQEVAISSAFGAEGMALIDMASRVRANFRLFTLDTEFLFPETYDLIERVEQRYEIKVERVYSALTPEDQEQLHGSALWKRD